MESPFPTHCPRCENDELNEDDQGYEFCPDCGWVQAPRSSFPRGHTVVEYFESNHPYLTTPTMFHIQSADGTRHFFTAFDGKANDSWHIETCWDVDLWRDAEGVPRVDGGMTHLGYVNLYRDALAFIMECLGECEDSRVEPVEDYEDAVVGEVRSL